MASTPIVQPKQVSAARILTSSGFGLLFDSFDVGLLSYVLVSLAKEWHLSTTVTGFIGSVSSIGMAVGSAFAGSLADKFGRRSIFLFTLLIYSIATGLSAFAAGVGLFILLRFFVGLGLGGELPVATTYVLESSPDDVRGRRVVFLEMFWAFGSLIAALVSFFVIPSAGWRVVFLIGAIPALYTIVLRFALPETPRYTRLAKRPSMATALKQVWTNGMARRSAVTWILWFHNIRLGVLSVKVVLETAFKAHRASASGYSPFLRRPNE
ncbi:MFS transporter [Alicyclobacillus suci]|uniref:MFS transporter n=1 Tax=Alicyclobacillus suci TaxID=2816080 RepID=UPI001A8C164E|nr:MFS transporter [Alicyclobacillus suci]